MPGRLQLQGFRGRISYRFIRPEEDHVIHLDRMDRYGILRAHSLTIVGLDIPEADQETMSNKLWKEYSALPIYLDEDVAEKHYNGFSNSILWYLLSHS